MMRRSAAGISPRQISFPYATVQAPSRTAQGSCRRGCRPAHGTGAAVATEETIRFGALLKHHRTAVHLTQEALAERAGLSARVISDLERDGARTPQRATVRLLAAALGLAESDCQAFESAAQGGRRAGLAHP